MAAKTTSVKVAILSFYGLTIEVKFKKAVKNIRLKVFKNAKITLTLPFYQTQKVALEFLELHKEWLLKTHKKVSANLLKDDEIYHLGKIYKINFDKSCNKVMIKDNEIFALNLKEFERFQKEVAREIFINLCDKFMPFINKNINKLTIRKMTTRWGSCNTKKGYINLNLNLIQKPLNLIEYVVLHELTHLIYPHHKQSFYEFIAKIMPDFKERQRLLAL